VTDSDSLDRHLRRPTESALERVVGRALAAEPRGTLLSGWRIAALTAGAALAAVALAVWLRPQPASVPVLTNTSGELRIVLRAPTTLAHGRVPASIPTVFNRADLVVLTRDERASIVSGGSR
jgi:hypothetical protein